MATLNDIFSWFQTGDLPTEAQFRATFSSFYHRDEKIPAAKVEGLAELLQNTATAEQMGAKADRSAGNLDTSDVNAWRDKLGVAAPAAGLATVDAPDGPGGNVYTKEQIAQMVAALQERDNANFELIDGLINRLESDDLDLDELQEVVDLIKQNRAQIEALQALAIGETTEDKVKLNSQYGLRRQLTQQDLNDFLVSRARAVNGEVHTITGSTQISHSLGSTHLIVQVRDSLTGRRIECEDYVSGSTVQINFLQDIKSPAQVLIMKIEQ